MNKYLLIAGILCILLGLAHSILGEYLIFSAKRKKGSIIPSIASKGLDEGQLRIIWATWHLATIFGWCLGAIILRYSMSNNDIDLYVIQDFSHLITYAMLAGAGLVCIATKGKHPGWIILLGIGLLLWKG